MILMGALASQSSFKDLCFCFADVFVDSCVSLIMIFCIRQRIMNMIQVSRESVQETSSVLFSRQKVKAFPESIFFSNLKKMVICKNPVVFQVLKILHSWLNYCSLTVSVWLSDTSSSQLVSFSLNRVYNKYFC